LLEFFCYGTVPIAARIFLINRQLFQNHFASKHAGQGDDSIKQQHKVLVNLQPEQVPVDGYQSQDASSDDGDSEGDDNDLLPEDQPSEAQFIKDNYSFLK
jgi:hypothetical protein